MYTAELERINHKLGERKILPLTGSILLIFLSVIFIGEAVWLRINFKIHWLYFFLGICFALTKIIFGIWGVHIFKTRIIDYFGVELVVYEPELKDGSFMWFFYFISLVIEFFAVILLIKEDIACLVVEIIANLFLSFWFIYFECIRNRRIFLTEQYVCGVTTFGTSYKFKRTEIKKIVYYTAFKTYLAKGDNDKKLFYFEKNMINGDELLQILKNEIPGKIKRDRRWARNKNEEQPLQWSEDQESWQTRYVDVIRRGFRSLKAINLIITILLFFLFTDLSIWYRILIIQLLPVIYFFYGWIFNDVMIWNMFSDLKASEEWKKKHISMLSISYFLFVFFLLSGLFFSNINILEGENKFWGSVLLLVLLLLGITAIRIKKQSKKISSLAIAAFMYFIFAWGVLYAMLPVTSHPSSFTHYPAQVTNFHVNKTHKIEFYHAEIILLNGEKKSINVSSDIYNKIEQGIPMVVCDRTTPLGIRYILLHESFED